MFDGDDAEEHGGWGAPCDANLVDHVTLRRAGHRQGAVVTAFIFGVWAVHRSQIVNDQWCDPQSWGVSHAPTGLSIGIALELSFWEAVRIARALEDTGVFDNAVVKDTFIVCDEEAPMIFEAAIGAALHDQYVWPMPLEAGE